MNRWPVVFPGDGREDKRIEIHDIIYPSLTESFRARNPNLEFLHNQGGELNESDIKSNAIKSPPETVLIRKDVQGGSKREDDDERTDLY
jgi:hypothetical protein